jgi:hypothetical protein
MFAGRNNIFIWATGWSFSTFNIFHRNIARVATLQAIVHAIAWSAIEGNCEYFRCPYGAAHNIDKYICFKLAILQNLGQSNIGIWVVWYILDPLLAIAKISANMYRLLCQWAYC